MMMMMKSSRSKQDSNQKTGLKKFSLLVCEKVKSKGTTTYNEVADELVAEFTSDPRRAFDSSLGLGGDGSEPFDHKNIRRRVYDALNVLMAIEVITKERKTIMWKGLPTNAAQECVDLEDDKKQLIKKIEEKRNHVRALLLQQLAYKKLVERNKTSQQTLKPNAIIKLPFLCVVTNMRTTINCQIAEDRSEAYFTLDRAFEIHDDVEILRRIGLVTDRPQDLADAKELLPKSLHPEMDLWCKSSAASTTNTTPAAATTTTPMPTTTTLPAAVLTAAGPPAAVASE